MLRVLAAMHSVHAVTLELDQAYSDIYNIYVYTQATVNEVFDYVTVWVSATTNYSAGVRCGGSIALLEGSTFEAAAPGTFLCPAASSVKYVTIVRRPVVTAGEQLVLDEVIVNRGGEQTGPWWHLYIGGEGGACGWHALLLGVVSDGANAPAWTLHGHPLVPLDELCTRPREDTTMETLSPASVRPAGRKPVH